MSLCIIFKIRWFFSGSVMYLYIGFLATIRKTSRSNRARFIAFLCREYLRLLSLSISNHDARPSYIVFCRVLKVSVVKLVATCCKLK